MLFQDRDKFDLVILDYHLPDANAKELVTVIRHRERIENLPRMPIISLTAEDPSRRHELFDENTINEVLTKPSSDQQLFTSIIDALRSSEAYATRQPIMRPAIPAGAGRLGSEFNSLFVEDLTLQLRLLRHTIDRGNWKSACHEAHKMKSIAGVLGYDALSAILSEARIGSTPPDDPVAWLDRVTAEVTSKFAEA